MNELLPSNQDWMNLEGSALDRYRPAYDESGDGSAGDNSGGSSPSSSPSSPKVKRRFFQRKGGRKSKKSAFNPDDRAVMKRKIKRPATDMASEIKPRVRARDGTNSTTWGKDNPGKGQRWRTPGKGRPLGSTNKIPRDIQEMVLEAIELFGADGEGYGGAVGYFYRHAGQNPELIFGLLTKIIPTQVRAKVDASLTADPASAQVILTQEQLAAMSVTDKISALRDLIAGNPLTPPASTPAATPGAMKLVGSTAPADSVEASLGDAPASQGVGSVIVGGEPTSGEVLPPLRPETGSEVGVGNNVRGLVSPMPPRVSEVIGETIGAALGVAVVQGLDEAAA